MSTDADQEEDGTRPFTVEEIENVFIDDHWNYGLAIHEKCAEALYAALGDPSEPGTGHALFARLYGEYAGSLETFGALGLAIRSRSTPGSVLKTYLTYENKDVRRFYGRVRDHDGDLIDLLELPSAETIIALGATHQHDIGANIGKFGTSLENIYARFKEASRRYLDDDGMQIQIYNKTKHGAPLLRLFEPENPRRFEIPVWQRNAAEPGPIAVFTTTRAEADKYINTVRAMSGSLQELGSIVNFLRLADLLYRPVTVDTDTSPTPTPTPTSNESSRPRR